MITMLKADNQVCKKVFRPYVEHLSQKLKKLVNSYEAEKDWDGVNDPFLQVEILRLFKYLGQDDMQMSDQISDILANVVPNTSNKHNSGCAVLLECVKTITSIQSSSTLKALAIKTSSQLLKSKDNNGKYTSLFVLLKLTSVDLETIQKHG